MLSIATGTRIFVAAGATDMRNYAEFPIMRSCGGGTTGIADCAGGPAPHNHRFVRNCRGASSGV